MNAVLESTANAERRFEHWFLACALAANATLYASAAINRSMLGFYICTIYGPALNAALIVAGIVAAILAGRKKKEFRLPRGLALAVGVPLLAAVILGSAVLWYIRAR
jgi:FtsH-binding integral membrane protein